MRPTLMPNRYLSTFLELLSGILLRLIPVTDVRCGLLARWCTTSTRARLHSGASRQRVSNVAFGATVRGTSTHLPKHCSFASACLGVLLLIGTAVPSATAATWTVNNTGDPATGTPANCAPGNAATCTLRDAFVTAVSGDTIVFAAALDGQTISLTNFSNDLGCVVNSSGCISGTMGRQFGPSAFFLTGARALTIDASANGLQHGVVIARSNVAGTGTFRLFDVDSDSSLQLIGLTLANGLARGGGSFYGGGAIGAGGAIFNQGLLDLRRCTLVGNAAQGGGYTIHTHYGGGGAGADSGPIGGGPNGGNSDGSNGGFGGGGGVWGGDGGFGGGGAEAVSGNKGFGGFGGGGGRFSDGGFGAGIGSDYGGAGMGSGGAIFNDAGHVSLVNVTLAGNSATGGNATGSSNGTGNGNGSGYGGALFNYSGEMTLDFVTLSGNQVAAGSGGSIAGNADGGAIYSLGDGWCGAMAAISGPRLT